MSKKKKKQQPKLSGPKVLIFDIETAPILAHVWGLWDNNVALNQVIKDWHTLSWSAKWLESEDGKTVYGPNKGVMYMDQRNAKTIEDDKAIMQAMWKLLDSADVVITQNGKAFDQKKLNARFLHHGLGKPSPFKHIDTKKLAQKHFEFPSFKLEYMTDKFCTKYKKLKHKNFSGHDLWKECLSGNLAAWKEMELYNKHDVLSLEELYHKLIPWDQTINFSLYHDSEEHVCTCGSTSFAKNGFYYTASGKYQKYKCTHCGAHVRDKDNLFPVEKRKSLKVGMPS